MMSQRAVDAVFSSLFILTDIRGILRANAPFHRLGTEDRAKVEKLLAELQGEVETIRRELLG